MRRIIKFIISFAAITALLPACRNANSPMTPEEDCPDFVQVTDVVPDVILEIRYYSTYNFIGDRIPGYEAPLALMTRESADSLKVVSDELKAQGYCLKIYDAYRPQCAVDHFMEWAQDMGGVFDYFGVLSHPDVLPGQAVGVREPINEEQYHNRMILREAMLRHGFRAYDCEWWHFTLENEPYPDTYFTFAVK